MMRPQWRIWSYLALLAMLIIGRFVFASSTWHSTAQLHALTELVAALIALFVGLLALVRYYTKQDNAFLFIGIGFIGAAGLDGYYAVTSGLFLQQLFPNLQVNTVSWNVSRTFLSVLVTGSWLVWRREGESEDEGRLNGIRLYVAIGAAAVACLIFFMLLPLQPPAQSVYALGRIEIFVSTFFFLLALVGYLDKGHWRYDPFEHWLILALIISLSGQAIFIPFSRQLFDTMFSLANLLKQASYLFVLTGLLLSMYSIFKKAERDAVELVATNDALHREIAERKRAETAEHEQRQMAEALREAGIALSATLDFEKLLEGLLDQIARVLPYDTANVMLVKGDENYIFCTRGYEQFQIEVPRRFPIADMPSLQQMAETGNPLVIPDTAVHHQWVRAEMSPHVRSWAGAPIIVQKQLIAFLALNNSRPNFYQPEDAIRLSAFAGQAAIAIQNARLYTEVQKRVEELTALNKISQAIISTLDLQETLSIITGYVNNLLGVAATSVALRDEVENDLWFAAASGEASDFVRGRRMAPGQGIVGWVVQNGQPLLVSNVFEDGRHFGEFDQQSGFAARSILCVPLQTKGKTIGALEALNKKNGRFDEEDLRMLTLLAAPAATAIENAQLYAQAQQEITERKRIEAALEAERALLAQRVRERTADLSAANSELARAARLKDEFLASMSHELRTPLNAVLGMSEALQEEILGTLNEDQKQSLKSIEESGRHLLSLINDILDVSKIEAGKLTLDKHLVSISSICQSSLRFIRRDALKKRLKVRSQVDSALTTIWADERRLKQILVNLLSNAVKFTPEGGEIGLEVNADETYEAINFTVWDTGIGISEADMSRLFRPFVQLDSRLNRQFTGTGLGLSLVYRMTELHGGGVSLESKVGQGSRFTISLPRYNSDDPFPSSTKQDLFPDEGGHSPPTRPIAPQNTRPATILLAEDNEANIETVSNYLAAKHYQVVVARNGEETIDRAREQLPDVILMDIQMPVMDGLEATRRLRADAALSAVPIIALTALAMPGDRERCLEAGANAYFSKPVSLKDLVSAVESQLEHNNLK